jgi:hypothetical protein
VQDRQEGTAGDLAQGQSRRSGVGAESFHETARKLDGEGYFDIADRDRVLEPLCLLQVAIGLALGDGAILGQSLGSLGPMRIPLQKGTGQVEPFGLLDMAGSRHMTYKYACIRHNSSTSSGSSSFLSIPHGAFKLKVAFCVTAVFTPVLATHSKSFSLIECISVGVDRMQRNFDPMRKQVEVWQRSELADVTAKVVI